MRVLQVSPTHHDACGIGTYSQSLETALGAAGVEVSTRSDLSVAEGYDVVVIQHEWGLFADADLRSFCMSSDLPVVIFAHSGGVEIFHDAADGFIAMHAGIVQSCSRPSLVIPPPAWVPEVLDDRNSLREQFGLGHASFVIGSSGFITGFRQFPEVLAQLLPAVRERHGFVDLVTARVGGPWFSETDRIEAELDELRDQYPDHFRYNTRFLSHHELNLRLQACDLLWCYTNRASSAYGSGTASDQYASGSAMVVADVEQHRYILSKGGVVPAPGDVGRFVDVLVASIDEKQFSRHELSTFAWPDAARAIATFLAGIPSRSRGTANDDGNPS